MMNPSEINEFLKRDVIGQVEALRFVSVAIFKHLLAVSRFVGSGFRFMRVGRTRSGQSAMR